MADQYGTPPPEYSDDAEIVGPPEARAPSAGQVLDKYIQALGGTKRLASVTSFVAKGTSQGFDTSDENISVEIYAKAPAQHTTVVHLPEGESVRTYDGRTGWMTRRLSRRRRSESTFSLGRDVDGWPVRHRAQHIAAEPTD